MDSPKKDDLWYKSIVFYEARSLISVYFLFTFFVRDARPIVLWPLRPSWPTNNFSGVHTRLL
jgi:hypothetical protein